MSLHPGCDYNYADGYEESKVALVPVQSAVVVRRDFGRRATADRTAANTGGERGGQVETVLQSLATT